MLPLPVHEPCAPSQLADFSRKRLPAASTMYRPRVDSGGCQVSAAGAAVYAVGAEGSATATTVPGAAASRRRAAPTPPVRYWTTLIVGIRASVCERMSADRLGAAGGRPSARKPAGASPHGSRTWPRADDGRQSMAQQPTFRGHLERPLGFPATGGSDQRPLAGRVPSAETRRPVPPVSHW